MKKVFLALFFAVLFAPTAFGYWNIPSIDQQIDILDSGKLRVTETIVADFTREAHRGIYREIPVSYKDEFGNPFNLRFKLISVTDENGKAHPVNKAGKEVFSDNYYLRIGDPDVWVSKKMTYIITYEIERAIGYFDEHDELYWNVFTYWEVPVLSSSVTVTLPEEVPEEDMQAACYTGSFGSTESNCNAEIINEKTFKFTGLDEFEGGEGFTIVAGFPKGIVAAPSALNEVLWFIFDNWALLIPVAVFLFLFLRWYFTGRDPQTRDTIFPHYKPPDDLTPTEVGTIVDEKVDLRDITTVIIDHAVKGYIKIKEIKEKALLFFDETDYELHLLKDYTQAPGIKSHEKEILDRIFGTKKTVKISKLKYKFYKHLEGIKKTLYSNLVEEGYFVHNPDKIRTIYFTIGMILTIAPLFALGALIVFLGLTLTVSIILSGILFIIFSRFMPRKTLKGAETYIKIRGLEEYIRTAEKDRLKFQEKKNIFFEKLLPYAMTLNLAEKWGEAFKDIYKKPPNWFEAEDMEGFNSYRLVNSLTHFSTKTQTAFASSPRSSGGSSAWSGGSGFSGGFSGGGFGGGGGGGW